MQNNTVFRDGLLDGQVAIVTGGGTGIGRGISGMLATLGAHVVIASRKMEHLEQAVREITEGGGRASALQLDVRDPEAVKSSFEHVANEHGRIDILVNNAGIANIGTATTTGESDFDRVMRVNVKGVYLCLQAVLPVMIEGGGGVVLNLSSIAAITGLKDRFAYSASKGAVHTMTLSVAADYLRHGIRCNAICPARVHTPFVDGYLAKNYPDNRDEMFEKLSKVQPIGRMARPEEVAKLALYLCSDDASYITAQSFNIDGGYMNLRN